MSTALSPAAFELPRRLLLKTAPAWSSDRTRSTCWRPGSAPILKREKLRDLNDLAERLRGRGADAVARDVVEAMTTNESFFFRDDKPFQHFRAQALARAGRRAPARQHAAHLVGRRPRPDRRPIRWR